MSPSDADLDAVADAERELAAAHLTLDLDAIDRLLHPDYVIVQPGGDVETKADVLASYRSGTRRWNEARVDELDLRLYRDTAVVVGRWQATGYNGSAAFDYEARFLSLWVKSGGGWQNVAYQATEVAGERRHQALA